MPSHHDHSASSRAAFAQLLRAERIELACAIQREVSDDMHQGSSLVVRTLLDRLAGAIESGEPDLVVHWARLVSSAHQSTTLLRLVNSSCDFVARRAETVETDFAALIVLLEIIKTRAAEALRSGALAEDQDVAVRSAIEGLLAALRARDEATCAHSYATGQWCRRLAEGLGLSPDTADRIVRGGILHDIGKLATPDSILLKTGPLSREEWAIMQQHAAFGSDILLEIPSLAKFAPIVRSHHERIDGRGYPDGLAGEEIPYEARVVSVADAFHAMVSDRPYRNAMSVGEALEVLREGRGRQWDAPIVDVMIATVVANRNASVQVDLEILTPTSEPVAARSTRSQLA